MNKFVGRMLELGAELDKAVSPIEISMVINDAEILYRNHIKQLNIPVVSNCADLKKELEVTDQLLNERQKVLDAIPECQSHGKCVPHAIEWIEEMKAKHCC